MKRALAALAVLLGSAVSTPAFDVLVFSRTTGFRHDAIPSGIACLKALAGRNGWRIACTEDPAVFTDAGLAGFDVTVWLMTTGDVLDSAGEEAFCPLHPVRPGVRGDPFGHHHRVGLALVRRARRRTFIGHPAEQRGKVMVEDRDHPAIPSACRGNGSAWTNGIR